MRDGLEASRRRARRNVVLTAAIAGLDGLLFGYDTGAIAGVLLFIKSDFDLGSFAQGLVVAAVPIGAVAGAAIAGPAADTYGRRSMILLAATVFIVGALASAAAPGVEVLVIARIVIGVAIGLASAAAPIYISEVAPMSGDDFAARATLAKIRVDNPDTIDRELEEIKDSLDEKPGAWRAAAAGGEAALVVGVGSSAGSILAADGVGVINVGMTLVALRLLDRAGRCSSSASPG